MLVSFFGGDASDLSDVPEGDVHGFKILSLRNLTYFLFAFGGVGTLATLMNISPNPVVVFVASILTGAFVGGITAATFHYVEWSESGEEPDESSFVGMRGTITVPIHPTEKKGKAVIQRNHRTFTLPVVPHDSMGEQDPSAWTDVEVVEMRSGTAYVRPTSEEQ